MFVSQSPAMIRKIFVAILLLIGSSVSYSAQAQDANKDALRKKIEMAMKRIELRIDKIDRDQKTMDEKAREQSGEYKLKLEAAKAELNEDLKKLPSVSKEDWKDFQEEVEEHLDQAKADIKPVML